MVIQSAKVPVWLCLFEKSRRNIPSTLHAPGASACKRNSGFPFRGTQPVANGGPQTEEARAYVGAMEWTYEMGSKRPIFRGHPTTLLVPQRLLIVGAPFVSMQRNMNQGPNVVINSVVDLVHQQAQYLDGASAATTSETHSLELPSESDSQSPVVTPIISEPERASPTVEDCLELLEAAECQPCPLVNARQEPLAGHELNEFKLELLRVAVIQSEKMFNKAREFKDIDTTIGLVTRALHLIPGDDSSRPIWLDKLGTSYYNKFVLLGDIEDLKMAVTEGEQAVRLTPDDHPDKPGYLNNLGVIYRSLFQRSNDSQSMIKAIELQGQAASLTSDDLPEKALYLSNLSQSYRLLSKHIDEPEYIETAIGCMERVISVTPEGDAQLPEHLESLADCYQMVSGRLGRLQDLERSIICREKVLLLTPEDHPHRSGRLNSIGNAYRLLFERLGRLEDLDQAINYLESAVALTPDAHEDLPSRLSNLGASNELLFERLGRLEDLHKGVACMQQAVILTPDDDKNKHIWLNNLGISYQSLFKRLGRLEDIEMAVTCKEQAVRLIPDGHEDKPSWLSNLGAAHWVMFDRLGRLEDIEKSITYLEQALSIAAKGHPDWPLWLDNLGISYLALFERLGRPEHLETAVANLEQAVMLTPDDHSDKPSRLKHLGKLYYVQFNRFNRPGDLLKAMLVLKQAACMPFGYPSVKLRAARTWALISPSINPESQLEAYKCTMTLLPQVVWLGVSANHRYESLTNIEVRALGMEAAAAAIGWQRYDLALEWLEQGRSVVWGQTLQLRAPFEKLHAANPELAEQLRQVSHDLEGASMQTSNQPRDSGLGASLRHRRLAETRERLLDDVRHLPGFGDFLRPNAAELVNLVQDGVVVIVNVYFTRCDALVVRAGADKVTHVPLASFSAKKAEAACTHLKQSLQTHGARRGVKRAGPASRNTLKGILEMLWFDVAKPILDHLSITQVLPAENLPHITWCTTGALSFLPLHAAGHYSHSNTVLANLAISSYIPTLSALRQTASPPATFSGILAVGHESAMRGLDPLPGTKAELDEIQAQANGLPFTRLDERNANADAVLGAMKNHSWVHLACHASQNSDDPMRSAFHLHDQDLDLATIARNQLGNAQLAFLSACQTATGDAALPDEAVHLAAGLLFAGYPTVIATMWSIQDQDAPLIARKVYEYLLEGGSPDSRKAAVALHKAVASLRDTIGIAEFVRWVPYVHIGR